MTRNVPVTLVAALVAVVLAACLRTTKDARRNDDLYEPSKTGAGESQRGTGTSTTPADDARYPAPIARWGELTRLLAQNLRSATTTCKDVATVVRTFTKQYGKEYGSTLVELGRWDVKAERKTVDAFYRRLAPDLDARIDAGIRCKDHTDARAAFDAFFKVAGLDTR